MSKPKSVAPISNKPEVARLAYGVSEYAEAIGVSPRHVWYMIKRGEIETLKMGGRTLISAKSATKRFEQAA